MAKAEEIFKVIREKLGGAVLEERLDGKDPFIAIDPARIEEVALLARDDPGLRFDLLSLVSAVDYPGAPASADGKTPARKGTIEVVYFLDSTVHRHRLILKARLDRESPRIRTVEGIWPAADWHERESFDLMGVVFEGHHNLVRILCAEDWEGHPLRKDYVIPESYHGIKNVVY